MSDADAVLEAMCRSYSSAVNASDAAEYSKLFTHADGNTTNFRLTVTWLLQRQASSEWLIRRQMWNRKPEQF